MDKLPAEILVHVFSFVDLNNLLLGVVPTCSLFRELVRGNSLGMQKFLSMKQKKDERVSKLVSKSLDIFGNGSFFLHKTKFNAGKKAVSIHSYTNQRSTLVVIQRGNFVHGKKEGIWTCFEKMRDEDLSTGESRLALCLWEKGVLKTVHTRRGNTFPSLKFLRPCLAFDMDAQSGVVHALRPVHCLWWKKSKGIQSRKTREVSRNICSLLSRAPKGFA
ncbi:hypothetical protein GMAR_ORF2 [Golden Marseillevirus]|uniref:hypothetical protein n=1 Tax=Golden Marseillevirus TaxID=1720526 RepID=UPI000877A8C5|nr:hypothetical protein GMAR_ORF2 [Golden Marseillevirus]ALX27377.1 hypothetical protein GMAR_ORF2 [Golden Marseillevirus]